MTTFSKSGGMVYHPYYYEAKSGIGHPDIPLPVNIKTKVGSYLGGKWIHNPYQVGWTAVKGANLATTIGQGNYMTRNYRQKPIVGLQTATHTNLNNIKRKIVAKISDRKGAVNIPTVSSRRTKSYSTKNKILSTNKAMPYRRKYRRSSKKLSKKKRAFRRKKYIPLALPRSRVVRMRTTARLALTANGGAIFQTYVKANSLNDPTVGYGAGLPLGLDQWAAQYQKYIVLGSKLKVRVIPTTLTGAANVGVYLADNTTALTNSDHYKELPNNKSCILTTQKDYCTITKTYSGKKFWRLTNIRDDSEQEATFSTTPGDPTDLAYYQIYIQDMAGSNNLVCDTQVELEFIVLLTDPITLAQSSL